MKFNMRLAIALAVLAGGMVQGQQMPPGVSPKWLTDPDAVPLRKAPPPVSVNTNDELAVTEARYNEVFKELNEIAQEQGRLQGEMRNLRNMKDPTSTFGTNDAEFVKMRAELNELEKRVKELRDAVAKKQMEQPEYKKVIDTMQDLSSRIQELEKRKKTLMSDRLFLVSKINNIKRQREEEAKKKAEAAADATTPNQPEPGKKAEKVDGEKK